MLRVLIVDDEPALRQGLRKIIPWEKYDFCICEDGVDGIDGLNKTLELQPDLLLVDIRMPGLNGIELIEKARALGFKGQIVILTGYSDFKYAQSAINLGVKAYLLKPIEEEELIKIIKGVYDEFQKKLEMQQILMESQLNSNVKKLKKLISEQATFSEEEIEFYHTYFNQKYFHITAIYKYETGMTEAVEDFFISMKNVDVINMEDQVVILFKGQSAQNIKNILKKLKESLFQKINKYVFIGVGRIVSNYNEIVISYQDARIINERRFLYQDSNIVFWYEIERIKENFKDFEKSMNQMDSDNLYSLIEIGDLEGINLYFENIENMFKASDYSQEKIKGICINFFIRIKEEIIEQYAECKSDFKTNEAIIHEFYEHAHLKALLMDMRKKFVNIANILCDASSQIKMKKIVDYIQKNYHKELRLEALAKLFNYNCSYLGKIFKSYTGESFNTYLDLVRIEYAKHYLIESELKVYQISEKVGFNNVDYFYNKFKKYTGTSPIEFKKL